MSEPFSVCVLVYVLSASHLHPSLPPKHLTLSPECREHDLFSFLIPYFLTLCPTKFRTPPNPSPLPRS
jgi:hypothetical protein